MIKTNNILVSYVNVIVISFFMLLISTQVKADGDNIFDEAKTQIKKPLWEAGAFTLGFHGPIYPAAQDTHNKFLAVPYVIYRGDVLRIGDGSIVKAVAIEKETFKFDVSLGAAFSANSDDSDIREDMPDLDFLFEIGPQASFLINNTRDSEAWFNLHFRSVFSTDFSSMDQRGYVFEPEISFEYSDLFFDRSRFFMSFSSFYATDKTHQYFYQVDQQYATQQRQAYQADAGYMGSKLQIANRVKVRDDLTVFFGVNVGIWDNAKNDRSPLFEEDFTYAFALGIRWTLFESDTLEP